MPRLKTGLSAAILAIVLSGTPAFAYIGPGMGAGTIAVVLGVLGSIFLAIFAILYYPVKRMIKGKKSNRKQETETTGE
ncbi:MAG: hypothetical protein AAGF53_17260 [Pseudomonadota bacterium]